MEKKKETFKPYISANQVLPEMTAASIILGIVLAIIFGAANAYLGLRVGLSVSASIPAAVISMGIIRKILKKDSILENNMVQTIGSAGESLAAGAIFTLPAIFMWSAEGSVKIPSILEIALVTMVGGILGVLFMIPLREALIVKEHGVLPYPEGTACAEVLLAGEDSGNKASIVFKGLGISALYKFITDGLKLFPSEVDYSVKQYKGAGVGADVLPALLGVGYICGPRISSYMFAGGMVAWLVLMPLIALFGGDLVMYPAKLPISELGTWDIWRSYVRYIGAGAVAMGGVISLMKSLPLIISAFKGTIGAYKQKSENIDRINQDIPSKVVLILIAAIIVGMCVIPAIPVSLPGAIIIVIFGFFFTTVSSKMVGIVGSSNNPVSGMVIATLLIVTTVMKAMGNTGMDGMVKSITIGTIICIIASMAGDTSQDLKTGYIVGATPKKQQMGEMIGAIVAALAIGGTLYLLNNAWGYGSKELPAPQASLMKMVVEGVMGGNLPWNLVFCGAAIALVIEILGIPVLPFAVGLYLPIHLSTPMMIGGLVRLFFEHRKKEEAEKKEETERGILFASGLIAGEGMIGILLAVLALIPVGKLTVLDKVNVSNVFSLGNIGSIIAFVILIALMVRNMTNKGKGNS